MFTRPSRMIGLISVALVLAAAIAARAFVHGWRQREEVIAQRLSTLQSLKHTLGESAAGGVPIIDSALPRPLRGRTPALAAAELQSLLRSYADSAGLAITRLEADGVAEEDSTTQLPMVPASLSAIGDLQALSRFLRRVQAAPVALDVTDLSVTQNAVFKRGMLQVGVTIRGLWVSGA